MPVESKVLLEYRWKQGKCPGVKRCAGVSTSQRCQMIQSGVGSIEGHLGGRGDSYGQLASRQL